jgi:hypothetical protein
MQCATLVFGQVVAFIVENQVDYRAFWRNSSGSQSSEQ